MKKLLDIITSHFVISLTQQQSNAKVQSLRIAKIVHGSIDK